MELLHGGIHHPLLRYWQTQPKHLSPEALIHAVFIVDDPDALEPIASMPGQSRYGINQLEKVMQKWVLLGMKSILIFGVISKAKDHEGTLADDPTGPVIQAVKMIRSKFPSILVCCDICLCPYTSHGHCGILNADQSINVSASTKRLAEIAVSYAKAGAHVLAPSDMIDGRIHAIKEALVTESIVHAVSVMSYSAKFASCFYGPFRDAANSSPGCGDRKRYQLPPGARGIALRAIKRDLEQGADLVMVKPGYPYLDIVRDAREIAGDYPIVVYQVSGEYSMLYHAGVTHGLIDLQEGVRESIESCFRAGASIVITYWTPQVLEWLKEK